MAGPPARAVRRNARRPRIPGADRPPRSLRPSPAVLRGCRRMGEGDAAHGLREANAGGCVPAVPRALSRAVAGRARPQVAVLLCVQAGAGAGAEAGVTSVVVEPIAVERKAALAHVLQLYLYDFTEFEFQPIREDGTYPYRYLDKYWAPTPGERRHAYFIRCDGAIAGFAMVRVVNGVNVMSEFFVM